MDFGKSWRALAVPPNFSPSSAISNCVKQGCVLARTLFSIFFSIMLREAKEDLPDDVYIRFRTDGSLFKI